MKKILSLLLSLGICSLEGVHFQSSTTVTPTKIGETVEYLVEMEINKFAHADSPLPELIAAPKLICIAGESSTVTLESLHNIDLLSVQVTIPKSVHQTGVQTQILIKEKGEAALTFDSTLKLNT